MGRIPTSENMISAMITNPQPGDQVPADITFNISVQTVHITLQDIGEVKFTTPPNLTKFAFFKGVDDAGNSQGLLQAVVEGGLPAGVYRACTRSLPGTTSSSTCPWLSEELKTTARNSRSFRRGTLVTLYRGTRGTVTGARTRKKKKGSLPRCQREELLRQPQRPISLQVEHKARLAPTATDLTGKIGTAKEGEPAETGRRRDSAQCNNDTSNRELWAIAIDV
ncbi:hypothetical protein V500_01755 [Pseudogymnoascus sp. VKM F-4518 (FW-2643)]|nr:hypothetical protein V500_01755 [Pseudogymnoascus sp. VKM F-4518 (FW-2643)]